MSMRFEQPGQGQSDGLASLLTLLNNVEDACTSSNREHTTANGSNIADCNQQIRITRGYNIDRHESNHYIWDDVQINAMTDVDGSKWPRKENEDAHSFATLSSTLLHNGVESADSIPQKVEKMQLDLKKKTKIVTDLKATLARKKLASKRRIIQMHSDWKVRIDVSDKAFEEKKKNLIQMHQQLQDNVICLRRKGAELKERIQGTLQQIPAKLFEIESKCRGKLLKEQEKLYRQEKEKLRQLAKRKIADMKKEAAIVIEPELRNLVLKHRDELENIRRELEVDLESANGKLQEKQNLVFRRDKLSIENEAEMYVTGIDKHFKSETEMISSEQETKLKNLSQSISEQMAVLKSSNQIRMKKTERDIKKERARRKEEHKTQLVHIQQTHKANVEDYHQHCRVIVSCIDNDFKSEFEEWKKQEKKLLLATLKVSSSNSQDMVNKDCEAEIRFVRERLRDRLNSNKKQMDLHSHQSAVKVIKDSHNIKVKQLVGRIKKIEWDNSTKEECCNAVILRQSQSRLNIILQKLNKTKQKLGLAKHSLELSEKELFRAKIETQEILERNLQHINSCTCNLKEELNYLNSKRRDELQVIKERIKGIEISNKIELATAENKINDMLRNKRRDLQNKRDVVTRFQSNIASIEQTLNCARLTDVNK